MTISNEILKEIEKAIWNDKTELKKYGLLFIMDYESEHDERQDAGEGYMTPAEYSVKTTFNLKSVAVYREVENSEDIEFGELEQHELGRIEDGLNSEGYI
jgi:hypothetical protein